MALIIGASMVRRFIRRLRPSAMIPSHCPAVALGIEVGDPLGPEYESAVPVRLTTRFAAPLPLRELPPAARKSAGIPSFG